MAEMDVKIGEVVTEMVVTEGVGSLSPEDVKRLVSLVLEQLRYEQDRSAQQQRDTAIHDRAFRGDRRG
jgi:polyhydroxyalkanoate synthesis regulator phasin